jgi:hypothetical protein
LAFLFVPVFRSCRLSGHCGHCVISLCLFVHNKINTVKWINWAETERGLINGACIFSCRLCPFSPSLHGSFLLLHVISLLFLTNIVLGLPIHIIVEFSWEPQRRRAWTSQYLIPRWVSNKMTAKLISKKCPSL